MNAIQNQNIKTILVSAALTIASMSFTLNAQANSEQKNYSFGVTNSQTMSVASAEVVNQLKKLKMLNDEPQMTKTTELQKTPRGKSRVEVQAYRVEQAEKHRKAEYSKMAASEITASEITASEARQSRTYLEHSFAIFSGYAQLIEDIDQDGYFQTFSVTFDADVISTVFNEQAVVFADLYLSENGGPWLHYFSTDDFIITAENTDDAFTVYTTLDTGYIPEHYDVLIDLFEVGYSDVVATYSSNETDALYALPLESSDYDPDYIEPAHYHEHGGVSFYLMLLIIITLIGRRVKTAI